MLIRSRYLVIARCHVLATRHRRTHYYTNEPVLTPLDNKKWLKYCIHCMRLKTLNNWVFQSLRKKHSSYTDSYKNYFVPSRIVGELFRQALLSLTVKYHRSKLLCNAYLGFSFRRRPLITVFSHSLANYDTFIKIHHQNLKIWWSRKYLISFQLSNKIQLVK